jgi:hypothetical protein
LWLHLRTCFSAAHVHDLCWVVACQVVACQVVAGWAVACQVVVCLLAKNETARITGSVNSFFVSSSWFCQKSVEERHVKLSQFEELIISQYYHFILLIKAALTVVRNKSSKGFSKYKKKCLEYGSTIYFVNKIFFFKQIITILYLLKCLDSKKL